MNRERFKIDFDGVKYFYIIYVVNEKIIGRFDTINDAKGYLELYEFYVELLEENEHLKNSIKEAYINERTEIGKSVLKQLLEKIQ